MASHEEGAEVYSGILKHKTSDVRFALTSSEFRWWPTESSEEGYLKIPATNVISVTSSVSGEHDEGILQICFAQRQKFVELRRVVEEFNGSMALCNACAELLQRHISRDFQRPKRALVIISPLSGLCKGKQRYEDIVAPLFEEAGIQTDVKEIERPLHATDIISKYDVTTVDSIVVVAGDGTYCEVINSLLRNHYASRDDDDSEPSNIGIPIGFIPTGTGNVIATRCYGTTDVETATLTIISGRRKRTGVFGVYSEGRLITYAGFSFAYGVYSDFMHLVSSKRDRTSYFSFPLGLYRGLKYFLFGEVREMDVTVKYAHPITTVSDRRTTSGGTSTIPTSANASAPPPELQMTSQSSYDERGEEASLNRTDIKENSENDSGRLQWTTKTDVYTGILAQFGFDTFAYDKTEGIQPGGVTRLKLYKPSSRWQLLKSVYHEITFNIDGMKTDENIENALVSEFIVKVNNASDPSTERGQKELRLAIDGDVVDLPRAEFHVKLFNDTVELFCNI